jgi:nucleotide-binding universal stress UspA family protein
MESKITNILFPINFISVSSNALNTAIRLTKRFNATLHLVEMNNRNSSLQWSLHRAIGRNKSTQYKSKEDNKLNVLEQTFTNTHNINCISKSLSGLMPVAVVEYAALNKIDLIVMGTKKFSKWKRIFHKPHLQEIVSKSACPSLIIPESKTPVLFHKILFPIRSHGGALVKYEFLKQFLSFDKPCIRLLVLSKNYTELADKQLQKIVNRINEELERDAVEVSGSVHADERFSKAVVQMSKSMEADLIVIAGDSDIVQNEKLPNKYQRDILDRSDIPVLNIKVNPFQKQVIYEV